MSRFYGNIQGHSGQVTRTGSKASGIHGHVRGWESGAKTSCFVNSKGQDVVEVYATNGSGCNQEVVRGLIFRSIDGKLDFLSTKKALK